MKKSFLLILVMLTAGFFFCQNSAAQDLVYRPKNPNFGGGDTFMYQQLLSQAESQNDFQEESDTRGEEDEVDQFTENLNRQLLNQISRELLQNTFGDDIIQEGTFVFGSLSLEIFPSSEGLVINILDTDTGSTSQIIIPN